MYYLATLNSNLDGFIIQAASMIIADQNTTILNVGSGRCRRIVKALPDCKVLTVDADPQVYPDYLINAEDMRSVLAEAFVDHVFCIEVLEHTLYPQKVVDEICRVLKPGGYAFVSVPFNLAIHGPVEYWRFTNQALEHLFREFEIVELSTLDTPNRLHMPIQYTLIARKPSDENTPICS